MTVMALDYVQAPAGTPARFGILSAAVVVEDNNPHMGLGYEYVPDFCGPARSTVAMCLPSAAPAGTASASVDAARTVSLTLTGEPAGDYHIDWGDGASSTVTNPATVTHTYPAVAGTSYNIVATGPDGWRATTRVNVTTGATSGPVNGTVETTKVADGFGIVQGDPFAVYALAECNAAGTDQNVRDRASRSLTTGEGRAVEEWLGQRLADDANVLVAAGLDEVTALALLEQYIHCNYAGVGTIHMNRGIASLLLAARALTITGDRLTTQLGNLVSAGCYGDPPDPIGPGVMYATGTVMLRRGPVFTPPDPIFDPKTNQSFGLAERMYAGSWECFAVGVDYTPKHIATQSGDGGPDLQTGSDTVEDAGGSWTPPSSGQLRNVSIVVTAGSATINGDTVTAPNTVNFDADTDEALTPPTVTTDSDGDKAVVSWTVAP